MAEEFVTRDQHRGDMAELRLEIANSLASLDKRTELIAQDLSAFRREMGEFRQSIERRFDAFQQTVTRQMWTMISAIVAVMLGGLIKLVFFP